MKITFVGAAREVTGSCFLVETSACRFLVDCGMVQGGREQWARNSQPFPFDAAKIDFVLLTHAHIDHSGLLPKLTKAGFSGPIHTTSATKDLLAIMLPDSAHVQAMEAERALRKSKKSRRKASRTTGAAKALYSIEEATRCLKQVRSRAYDAQFQPHADVRCRFRDAGHILGSALLEVWVNERGKSSKLVFSGDLGQPGRPILRDPTIIEEADFLLIESTYGDRPHKDQVATDDELIAIIDQTLHAQGGNVIVPAFAVGRTQEILYSLQRLRNVGRLGDLKIYVDSPMATAATQITMRHMALFDEAASQLKNWKKLEHNPDEVHFVGSVEESKALNTVRAGAFIISASGMCDAGRIRHHLLHNLGRPECAVVITGFQAQGTLGRRLVDGVEQVRIMGEKIPVRASIHTLGGLSAHADQQALLAWAAGFRRPPRQTFVVHGEERSALALAQRLRTDRAWSVTVPGLGECINLAEFPAVAPSSEKILADESQPAITDQVPQPTRTARVETPTHEQLKAMRDAIVRGASYRIANEDADFLSSDDLRPVRLQLELLKPEQVLRAHCIRSTVVVFGSARIKSRDQAQEELALLQAQFEQRPDDIALSNKIAQARRALQYADYYEEARRFANIVSDRFQSNGDRDFVVVTGGGGGIMEAANRGAYEAGARSIGLNITVPAEQQPNPYITPELAFKFRYFALRKLHFLLRARALVAFPGGFGTLDELFEVLTLLQTGKVQSIPVILIGRQFWEQAVNFEFLVDQGMIARSDLALFKTVDTVEDAVAVLDEFYTGTTPPVA